MLHRNDHLDIRKRAQSVLRCLRDQGFDRAHIVTFAAEVLGQLETSMREETQPKR